MYELKKIGKVFTSKFVGTGPSSFEKKRIYRAAVSQMLRNTGLEGIVSRVWVRRSGARISVVASDSLLKTSKPVLEPTQHPTQWVPGFIPCL